MWFYTVLTRCGEKRLHTGLTCRECVVFLPFHNFGLCFIGVAHAILIIYTLNVVAVIWQICEKYMKKRRVNAFTSWCISEVEHCLQKKQPHCSFPLPLCDPLLYLLDSCLFYKIAAMACFDEDWNWAVVGFDENQWSWSVENIQTFQARLIHPQKPLLISQHIISKESNGNVLKSNVWERDVREYGSRSEVWLQAYIEQHV